MSSDFERLWQLASELRGQMPIYRLQEFIQHAQERGIELSHSDVRRLAARFPHGEFYIPEIIPNFVATCLPKESGLRVLDPWAGMGGFLDEVAGTMKAKEAIAITPNKENITLGKILSSHLATKWHLGDPLEILETIEGQFDVVLSCPPFNWEPQHELVIETAGKKIKVRDLTSNFVILKSAMLLSKNGIAFYVVPNSFFFGSPKNSVRSSLPELGLYIDAIFSLPAGTFSPSTSIPSNLLVIRPEKKDGFFVAELNPDADFDPILENWRKRKAAKTFSLGLLVDPKEFTSYHALYSRKEMERLASGMGLRPFPLRDLIIEMNLENKRLENGFEAKPNSIYLPLIGHSEAHTQVSRLKLKPQNYVQIVLEPSKAFAEFVARSFNTRLGKLVRESVTSVGVIPKISKSSLYGATIYLLPLEVQAELIEIQSEITDLTGQLNTIQNTLWEKPFQYNRVRKALKSINREVVVAEWLETLPFPLASILRRYHADHSAKAKNEHLLRFFEAFAQFLTTLMLSALRNEGDLFQRQRSLWVGSGLAGKLKRSSFGTWLNLGQQTAKVTRRELSSRESRERCLRMYRRKRSDFLESIVDKRIYEVLNTASEYRNLWKGHGGIVGEKEEKGRLTLVENELAKLRESISDCFEGSMLFRPKNSNFSEGVFDFIVVSLMGSHTTFKEEEIQTIIPLDIKKLYLVERDNAEPLEILPFIKIMPSPKSEENACYFYNRLEKEGIRWISYHFEKESDITEDDEALKTFISLFESEDVDQKGYNSRLNPHSLGN